MLKFRFDPVFPRHLYFLSALVILVIAILDVGFCVFPAEPVLHYVIGFCVGVLLCEIINLLKWIWFRYLW
jgi:hypothetical protein